MNKDLRVLFVSSCEEHEITLSPKQDLTFSDIDCWVRQRFHFTNDMVLVYKNEEGLEILPNFSNKKNASGCVKVYIESKKVNISVKKRQIPHEYLIAVPLCLVLLFSLSCTNDVVPYTLLKNALLRFDLPESLIVDIYTSFVSWTVSYFFVRRSLNPEYSGVLLERFAIDTLFGGLAAMTSVVLKYVLKLYISD